VRSKSDLHDFQIRSITEFYENTERLGIVPMGGGKTVSALTAAQELIRDGHIRSGVVMAPRRVAARTWPREVLAWEHLQDFRLVVVTGTPAQRLAKLEQPADLYVVGIDNTQWLTEIIETWDKDDPRLDLLIIDELSRYKKPDGKRSRALSLVADFFDNRWGLTGTPRPNSEIDLFQPARILTRRRIWDCHFDDWKLENFKPDRLYAMETAKWTVRAASRDDIWKSVADFSFTVGADELPPQPDLVPVEHWVDLPPAAQTAFDDMMKHLIYQGEVENVLAENAGVASGKADQIAQGFIYKKGEVLETLHTAKRDMLLDLIEGLGGQQALITYWYRADLEVLRGIIGRDCPYLGSGTSDKQADKAIDAWNERGIQLLPVHPQSAGHGLNMQEGHAGQIIHYCPTWSAELFDQVCARLARQGNEQDRVMNHLILANNTFDIVKRKRVLGKQSEQKAFIEFVSEWRAAND